MKKIYLEEVHQHDKVFYSGKIDPRILIHLADDIKVGEIQDAQRPLEKKHLQEIAEYVGGEDKGVLPGSVMLSTKFNSSGQIIRVHREKITIISEDGTTESQIRNYIFVPTTPSEIEQYKGVINIIDGQHRVFSFRDDVCSPDLKDTTVYEITFSLFETPKKRDRQMLFMVTNEKQKSVNPNLLLWLRLQLDLLSDKEETYYPIVSDLNNENCSPLKGRIIMNAEKISKGYKAKELIKILDKTFPESMLIGQVAANAQQKFDALCRYLQGWENFYGLSFQHPQKDTMTKISGLRYILWLFPLFWEISISERKPLNDDFIGKVISDLQSSTAQTNLFSDSILFRSEGGTAKAVKSHTALYKVWKAEKSSQSFNPLA